MVIYRLPKNLSVVSPRSSCPKCGYMIPWYDNVPVVSWLLLGRRCRKCRTPISFRYPLIECMTGLIFFAAAIVLPSFELVFVASLLGAVSVAVAWIDIDTWTIRMETLIVMAVLALGLSILGIIQGEGLHFFAHRLGSLLSPRELLREHLLGAFVGFSILYAVRVLATWYFRKKGRIPPGEEAMGMGDPLLLGVYGGIVGWPLIPVMLFLSSLQGAVVGGIVAFLQRGKAPEPVPGDPEGWTPPSAAIQFGPFLALAGVQALFFGESLLSWMIVMLGGA